MLCYSTHSFFSMFNQLHERVFFNIFCFVYVLRGLSKVIMHVRKKPQNFEGTLRYDTEFWRLVFITTAKKNLRPTIFVKKNGIENTSQPTLIEQASGNLFKCHEEVLYLQPLIPPKRFDIFSPITGGCSEDLGVL